MEDSKSRYLCPKKANHFKCPIAFKTFQKELIATGGFGSVYKAYDNYKGKFVAIKVERKNSQNLICSEIGWEAHIINKLKGRGQMDKMLYVISCPLQAARTSQPYSTRNMIRKNGHQFSPGVVAMIGKQCLYAVQALHQAGFVHRDIKPANFAVGLGDKIRTIHLIDYGMCKRYRDKDGNLLSNRGEVGFRGTVRYASCKAHLSMDLGRGDDLISFFYMLYELMDNHLPWWQESDVNYIFHMKLTYRLETMAAKLGSQMKTLAKHVSSLDFSSEPNYELILQQLTNMMTENSVTEDTPFGWEAWLASKGSEPM
ncbi:hypothetical protein D918_07942 [Trichuris suis]|nr:hypothetical protein D918_07942 [Trichuris suis]